MIYEENMKNGDLAFQSDSEDIYTYCIEKA